MVFGSRRRRALAIRWRIGLAQPFVASGQPSRQTEWSRGRQQLNA